MPSWAWLWVDKASAGRSQVRAQRKPSQNGLSGRPCAQTLGAALGQRRLLAHSRAPQADTAKGRRPGALVTMQRQACGSWGPAAPPLRQRRPQRPGHECPAGRRRAGEGARQGQGQGRLRGRASESDSPPAQSMTAAQASSLLGVDLDDPFDRVVAAKNKMQRSLKSEEEKIEIETAYDVLLMRSMSRRLTGQGVNKRAQYADVPPPGPPRQVRRVLQALPFKVGPANGLRSISITYALLGGTALAQGLWEPPAMALRDVPGTQLALGVLASLWFFKDRKNQALPRSGFLAVGGLAAGTLVGAVLQSWLRVDVLPLFGLQSPGIFVSEFSLLGLWAATAYAF